MKEQRQQDLQKMSPTVKNIAVGKKRVVHIVMKLIHIYTPCESGNVE